MAAEARRRPRRPSSWIDRHLGWLLVSPAVTLVFAFSIFPLAFSLWVLFVEFDFSVSNEHPWVGLDNFSDNWIDPVWWNSIKVTAVLSISVVLLELALGLLLALAMVKPFRGRRVLMILIVMPLFIAPVVVGGFWDLFLRQPIGAANEIVGWFWPGGVETNFTEDWYWPYLSVIIADSWQWTPFMFVILLAGLSAISPELYEAAEIDGANGWRRLFSITLPLLNRTTGLVVVLQILASLKLFDQAYILFNNGGGGPGGSATPILQYVYDTGFVDYRLGYASAISYMFFVLIILIALVQARLSNRRSEP
jgi:multiple sugar transport system permease protein